MDRGKNCTSKSRVWGPEALKEGRRHDKGRSWELWGIRVERKVAPFPGKEGGAELSVGTAQGDLPYTVPSHRLQEKPHYKEARHWKNLISREKCSEGAKICVGVRSEGAQGITNTENGSSPRGVRWEGGESLSPWKSG